MPLHGPLTEGLCVRLGWPEEDELDAITALRNRPEVRSQFLDRRPLDAVRNREWIRTGMKRPLEAMLAIRLKHDNAFVGAIGWSHGDPVNGSLELGRVMIDTKSLRARRPRFPESYPGVAVDAGVAVRDYAFATFGLRLLRMEVIETNRLSLRAAMVGGGRIVGARERTLDDGSTVRLITLEYDRADWYRSLAAGCAKAMDKTVPAALPLSV
jgi:RimJ/RimL family protein N-acetyltransferase